MNEKQIELFRKLKEDDIPITKNGDSYITPNKVYEEDLPLVMSMPNTPDWELLEKRLEAKYEKGMILPIYTINGELTSEQQMEEVRNKTEEGYKLMLAENGLLRFLMQYE